MMLLMYGLVGILSGVVSMAIYAQQGHFQWSRMMGKTVVSMMSALLIIPSIIILATRDDCKKDDKDDREKYICMTELHISMIVVGLILVYVAFKIDLTNMESIPEGSIEEYASSPPPMEQSRSLSPYFNSQYAYSSKSPYYERLTDPGMYRRANSGIR
jgi:hypothetical protein